MLVFKMPNVLSWAAPAREIQKMLLKYCCWAHNRVWVHDEDSARIISSPFCSRLCLYIHRLQPSVSQLKRCTISFQSNYSNVNNSNLAHCFFGPYLSVVIDMLNMVWVGVDNESTSWGSLRTPVPHLVPVVSLNTMHIFLPVYVKTCWRGSYVPQPSQVGGRSHGWCCVLDDQHADDDALTSKLILEATEGLVLNIKLLQALCQLTSEPCCL